MSEQYGYFPTARPKDVGIIMSVLASLQPDMLKIFLMVPQVT